MHRNKLKVFVYSLALAVLMTAGQDGFAAPAGRLQHRDVGEASGIKRDTLGPHSVYISTAFENASPLNWHIDEEGTVNIYLMKDHQRFLPNIAVTHFYFRLFAPKGADVKLVFRDMDGVYKGKTSYLPAEKKTYCLISTDGKKWSALPTTVTDGQTALEVALHMDSTSVYLAEIPPYTLSDLKNLFARIKKNARVKVTPIGYTAQGRPINIVRIGNPYAPHSVFIRARAHAFESGGNYVVEGLIHRLLKNDEAARRYLEKYCVYILPMANKDGVAGGKSRYTAMGMDLNRQWFELADPEINPENYALEMWIKALKKKGIKPDLAFDLHNDKWGWIHLARPPHTDLTGYLENMKRFSALLYRYSWYQFGNTGPEFRDKGAMAEGLLKRYGINAATIELNYSYAKGLKRRPTAEDWEVLGAQLSKVFYRYFEEAD